MRTAQDWLIFTRKCIRGTQLLGAQASQTIIHSEIVWLYRCTCRNQNDYFLVQERWKSSICKCKAIQGAECDSDNSRLGMKFKLKLRRLQKPRVSTQYDCSNVEQFHTEPRKRFTTLATPEAADPQNSVQSSSECKHSGVQMTCGERTMNSQGTDANAAMVDRYHTCVTQREA